MDLESHVRMVILKNGYPLRLRAHNPDDSGLQVPHPGSNLYPISHHVSVPGQPNGISVELINEFYRVNSFVLNLGKHVVNAGTIWACN